MYIHMQMQQVYIFVFKLEVAIFTSPQHLTLWFVLLFRYAPVELGKSRRDNKKTSAYLNGLIQIATAF